MAAFGWCTHRPNLRPVQPPEWALRLPFCLTVAAGAGGRVHGRFPLPSSARGTPVGVGAGTFPMFSLVARQAMTDMALHRAHDHALAFVALAC